MVDLANNSINGQASDVPQALRSVVGLDLSQNSLQGTVPLSWLQAGNFLSHVSYLNLGQAWDNSVLPNNWRQTLCLHEDLYRADVTGHQLALLPKLVTSLVGQDAETAGTDTSACVQEGLSETAALGLIYTFDQGASQLLSVSTICANPSATRVLLIVWLVFAGCCLAMLARMPVGRDGWSSSLAQWSVFCLFLHFTDDVQHVFWSWWPCILLR